MMILRSSHNKFFSLIVVLLLIIGSIRGAIVIHFGFDHYIVYPIVAGLLLMLSMYGVLCSVAYKDKILSLLKVMLAVNIILFVIHFMVSFIGSNIDAQTVKIYMFLFLSPYMIFVGLLLKEGYLEAIIIIITCFIGLSVISNFIDMASGNGGDFLYEYRSKLRGSYIGMSKSGSLYGVVMQRIGGYTGSMHDSGNILGMSSVYFLVKYFIRIKKSDLFFFCIALLGLLMTQSTTNIIVSFFVMTIFYLYILTKKFNMRLLMLGGVALVIIAFIVLGEFIQVLFSRIIDDEARAGMYNQLSVEQLLSALPIMFVGHGNDLGAQYMQIEIGLMKIVYQLGVFHACLLFLILLFPSYLFFKEFKISKDNMLLLPPLAVNIFGFLSLLHYGSLLRSTSIFLYFMISAMFIIIYYKHRFIPLKQYVR